jgi:hypothetical protein
MFAYKKRKNVTDAFSSILKNNINYLKTPAKKERERVREREGREKLFHCSEFRETNKTCLRQNLSTTKNPACGKKFVTVSVCFVNTLRSVRKE